MSVEIIQFLLTLSLQTEGAEKNDVRMQVSILNDLQKKKNKDLSIDL